jgi:hypothetical protein
MVAFEKVLERLIRTTTRDLEYIRNIDFCDEKYLSIIELQTRVDTLSEVLSLYNDVLLWNRNGTIG